MRLAQEGALEDAHIELLWSLTEKVCARLRQGFACGTQSFHGDKGMMGRTGGDILILAMDCDLLWGVRSG